MIYYFSGTGNSEWVAKELAVRLQTEAIAITSLEKQTIIEVGDGETVGFIFPIHAWAPPKIMAEFIKHINYGKDTFKFMVGTCESEAGTAMKKLAKEIGIQSGYSVSMPNNYIIGTNVDTPETIDKKIKAAKIQIENICDEVKAKEKVWKVANGRLGGIKSVIAAPMFQKYAISTKPFHVEESCIGCGVCVRSCPLHSIKLVENKPVWDKACTQCLSCINHCPKEAIQYGEKTKGKARYFLKKYMK